MATFNGHKNWNHWNVALWVANDETLYNLARECIRTTANRDQAARAMLDQLAPETPDGAPYSVTTLKAAMRGL